MRNYGLSTVRQAKTLLDTKPKIDPARKKAIDDLMPEIERRRQEKLYKNTQNSSNMNWGNRNKA